MTAKYHTFNSHLSSMDTRVSFIEECSLTIGESIRQSTCLHLQNIGGYKQLCPLHLTLWGDRPLLSLLSLPL